MVTFATEDSLCMRKILDVDGVTYFFVRHVMFLGDLLSPREVNDKSYQPVDRELKTKPYQMRFVQSYYVYYLIFSVFFSAFKLVRIKIIRVVKQLETTFGEISSNI